MLRTLFVFAILIPGIAAAFTSRFAALLVYIFYSLFRPQDWLWVDITGLHLSLLLSVLVVGPWDWLRAGRVTTPAERTAARTALPNLTHPLTVGMVLFLGTALVAQSHAADAATGLAWLDYLWRVLLISAVAATLVDSPGRFTMVLAVIAGSLGFHSTKAGLMAVVRGGARIMDGLGGAYVDNNGYAMAIVMVLPLMVAAAQNTANRWVRRALYAAIAPSIFTVVCTFSRAGFLALAFSALVFLLLQRRRALALAALVPIAALLIVVVPNGYVDRLKTIQTYQETNETSALSRLHFWRVAVDVARDNPYGVGLQNFERVYDRYDFSGGRYGSKRSVHSSHLQVLAETGYDGLIVYVGMFTAAFVLAFRIRRRSASPTLDPPARRFLLTVSNALIVSMAAFLVGGAFIALALNDLTWLTFGLIAALDRISKRMTAAPAAAPAREALRSGRAPLATALSGAFHGSYRTSSPMPPAPGTAP